jgi:hypothetical protein
MSAPVVVSRIQNRRGTQTQFNALYPPGYSGVGGFGGLSPVITSPNNSASSVPGTVSTLDFQHQILHLFLSGLKLLLLALHLLHMNGTYIVTVIHGLTSITYASQPLQLVSWWTSYLCI